MKNIEILKEKLQNDKELACLLLLAENLTPQIFPLYLKVSTGLLQMSGRAGNLGQKSLNQLLKKISSEIGNSTVVAKENDFQKALDIFKDKAQRFVSMTDSLYCLEDFIDGLAGQMVKIQTMKTDQEANKEDQEETAGETTNPTAINTSDAQIKQTETGKRPEAEETPRTIGEILGNDTRVFVQDLSRRLNGKDKSSKDLETAKFFKIAQNYTGRKLISPDVVDKLTKNLLNLKEQEFQEIYNLLLPMKNLIFRIRSINSTGTQDQLEKILGKPMQQKISTPGTGGVPNTYRQ